MTNPITSADFDNDWAKERAFVEGGVERMLEPVSRPRYNREQTPRENTTEQLNDIQRENVEASQRNYQHEE